MVIRTNDLSLPVTSKLTDLIKKALVGNDLSEKTSITLNFRDPDYSAENGGYHPVEIMLKRRGDEWHFQYITDFFYVGVGPYAELVKDLDFDFGAGVFQTTYGYFRIEDATDIFSTWQDNFVDYYCVFDAYKLEITLD